ncbi:CLAVATA3/ESR (CLE)-related protein 43 [Striga hermonthica]|uniref:CLAVATA3/ESR (CLE)-related protein 43 n=1 Tax=Striga hermonthica TaxID=68872 RepID=A0A9N7MU47_STRHE|nr:CLAVATA3/ESR (CLE)-related protein 43 [Striga hermonthica]
MLIISKWRSKGSTCTCLPAAMSSPGCKRRLYPSSLVALLIVSLLYIWASSSQTKAVAIRLFPPSSRALVENGQSTEPVKSRTQVFREYFKGRVSDLNNNNGTFADYKRKIPSCPDPLHN